MTECAVFMVLREVKRWHVCMQACEAADRYVQAWLPSCSAPTLVTLKRAHSKRPRSMITLPLAALIVSAGVRGTSRRDQPLCGSCASCEFKCNYMHRYIHIYICLHKFTCYC